MNDAYTYSLTPIELDLSVALLNLNGLPLPFGPDSFLQQDMQANPRAQAEKSLEEKCLLRRGGDYSWQIDPLLSETVFWLAVPRFALLLETIHQGGEPECLAAYHRDRGDLLAAYRPGQITFTLFEDQSCVFDQVLAKGGVSGQSEGAGELAFALPPDVSLAGVAQALFGQHPALEFFSRFRFVVGGVDSLRCIAEVVLIGHARGLWRATLPYLRRLQPVSAETATLAICGQMAN